MLMKMTKEEMERLTAALRADEDCEENGDGSFTVDLYEPEDMPVLSVELYPEKDGFSITAVCLMEYSEELKGWYLSDKIKDEAGQTQAAERIRAAFLC